MANTVATLAEEIIKNHKSIEQFFNVYFSSAEQRKWMNAHYPAKVKAYAKLVNNTADMAIILQAYMQDEKLASAF